uniref:Uncharacterized protein n=1 Tax=Acrobeloides nanus TaxID=290746 RepID=A0A914CL24_9BILA
MHSILSAKQTQVKTSLIILTAIILVQFLICILWISLRPPKLITGWNKAKYCSSNTELQTIVLMLIPLVLVFVTFLYQRKAGKNRILFQVRQARAGIAGSLCFVVNYAVLLPLMFMEDSPENVKSTILMCIPMLAAWISWVAIHLPVCYETFIRKEQNSHEFVSRERSRQFRDGNVVYYVDAIVLNRARASKASLSTNHVQ